MSEKIGFIGLGRMGLPMSYNLLRAGYDLTVHNRSQEKVRQIADAGATAAASTAEIMEQCDVVLACLPDVATCEQVVLEEALPKARPGQVIVDHSTVGTATSKACAAAAEERGAMFLDAPISGGTERATDGTLTIMVGGPTEAYQRVASAFDVMGAVVRHVGPTGSGTAAKLVNQLLVGVHKVAAAEAMLLAAKSGADPALVFELVNSGWGQSFILGRNAPAMLDRDFEGVRTQLRVFLKDLGLIQEMARDLETPIPGGDLAYRLFYEATEQGLGDMDGAAIVLPMEEQAGFQVRRVDAE
ncbi:MAG: NAD(P)-dependent oxidoreductase [Chloroflexi bacterium]|nr:NAD(P)-dependent oxidoreductase [Chloroflexota bacterium]MYD47298.1 NAD(P)-dependent oxidoreductase [Chloroflexota bacterium]